MWGFEIPSWGFGKSYLSFGSKAGQYTTRQGYGAETCWFWFIEACLQRAYIPKLHRVL